MELICARLNREVDYCSTGQTLLGDDQALSFTNPLNPGGPAIVIEDATGARPIISVNAANATDCTSVIRSSVPSSLLLPNGSTGAAGARSVINLHPL